MGVIGRSCLSLYLIDAAIQIGCGEAAWASKKTWVSSWFYLTCPLGWCFRILKEQVRSRIFYFRGALFGFINVSCDRGDFVLWGSRWGSLWVFMLWGSRWGSLWVFMLWGSRWGSLWIFVGSSWWPSSTLGSSTGYPAGSTLPVSRKGSVQDSVSCVSLLPGVAKGVLSVPAGVRAVGVFLLLAFFFACRARALRRVFVVAFFGTGQFYGLPGGQYPSCVQEGLGSGLGLLRVFAAWGYEGCARFSIRLLLCVMTVVTDSIGEYSLRVIDDVVGSCVGQCHRSDQSAEEVGTDLVGLPDFLHSDLSSRFLWSAPPPAGVQACREVTARKARPWMPTSEGLFWVCSRSAVVTSLHDHRVNSCAFLRAPTRPRGITGLPFVSHQNAGLAKRARRGSSLNFFFHYAHCTPGATRVPRTPLDEAVLRGGFSDRGTTLIPDRHGGRVLLAAVEPGLFWCSGCAGRSAIGS